MNIPSDIFEIIGYFCFSSFAHLDVNIHSVVIGCTSADCTVMEIGENMRWKSAKKNWGNPNGNQEVFTSSPEWKLFSFPNVLISFERKHWRKANGSEHFKSVHTKTRLRPLLDGFLLRHTAIWTNTKIWISPMHLLRRWECQHQKKWKYAKMKVKWYLNCSDLMSLKDAILYKKMHF